MSTTFNDLISEQQVTEFIDHVSGNEFPWFLQPVVENPTPLGFGDRQWCESPLLRHNVVLDGKINTSKKTMDLINPILISIGNRIGGVTFTRVGVNLLLPDSKTLGKYSYPHIDVVDSFPYYEYNNYTAIWYPHDSDGNTILFGEDYQISEEITPERNKLVVWKNKVYHSAPASASDIRITVNINFFIEEGREL